MAFWKKIFNNSDRVKNFREEIPAHQETLERILFSNIVSFWYPEVIDHTHGGYQLNHDLYGKWKGSAPKTLVTQARTVWFFSKLMNAGWEDKRYLEAAAHGYTFLRERMWDKQFGGFYWETDSTGNLATLPNKHLYAQAFGLFAVSEYARASNDTLAQEFAQNIFSTFDKFSHDTCHGGYREFFQENWNPIVDDTPNYLGSFPSGKLMNTHLHLLEAITVYYQLTHDSIARERLIELIFVQSNSVVRKSLGACTDQHQSDWTPLQDSSRARVSYGHDLENVYMLITACETLEIPNALFVDLYRTLFDYALQYGFDHKDGGFFESGPVEAHADRRNKIWWVQAECLLSALHMYRITQENKYWNCFSKTLDWIVHHQVDWEHGDWFACIGKNKEKSGDKTGPWKSPYHNGRAMILCLQLLSELTTPLQ